MNHHNEIEKQLAAYCGGDLTLHERSVVEQHLADCTVCRAELADLEVVLRLMRTTPEVEAPPWLATRIMSRIREQQSARRSWFQRIFMPFHVKLPLEALALLLVCVSGYYVARTVEPELQSPTVQQDVAVAPRDVAHPPPAPSATAPAKTPAAMPSVAASAPQAPVAAQVAEAKKDQPTAPPALKATEQIVPQRQSSGAAAPLPSPASAAPALKEEKSAVLQESLSGDNHSREQVSEAKHAKKAKKSVADAVGKGVAGSDHELNPPAALRDTVASGAGVTQPQLKIHLRLTIPAATATDALKEALGRSGGALVVNEPPREHIIKARIPAARLAELLERLERCGRITGRPELRSAAGVVELEIDW
jgi:hypothetical protein